MKNGSILWKEELRNQAENLRSALRSAPANSGVEAALEKLSRQKLEYFLEGLRFYLETPAPPPETGNAPVLWQEGTTRLLDYGSVRVRDPKKPAVLFVPSLINKAYILNLLPERSLLKFLADEGFHPLLLDWQEPGKQEVGFSLSDYVTERLEAALAEATELLGRPVVLAGYCMGGLLALAAALREKKKVSGLVLLATPWDFHSRDLHHIFLNPNAIATFETLLQSAPTVPAATIHSIFYCMNPFAVHRKFERLYELSKEPEAEVLLARERWVNDGVPLTREAARTCFIDWAAHNKLMNDVWNVGGSDILPEKLHTPTFIALPQYDQIVPPGCSTPLADKIPHAKRVTCTSGHVGMIVGRKAKESLWLPLAKWLANL